MHSAISAPLDYETAKRLARSPDAMVRAELAACRDVPPEILAFLAGDPDAGVRAAAAANQQAPLQTSRALSRDPAETVRLALAGRIVRLLPELDGDGHKQAFQLATEALMALAIDEALKIREALASSLKDIAMAPPKVVRQLAYDTARAVAEPVLRYCLLLEDVDLLHLLATRDQQWLRLAIAARPSLSEPVSGALVARGDVVATGALLDNQGARIGAETLSQLVGAAEAIPAWHSKLAKRPDMPQSLLQKLAAFVDETVLAILRERSDLDSITRQQVVAVARRRLESAQQRENMPTEPAQARALRWLQNGILNENAILDALAMDDRAFVVAGIALLAKVSVDTLQRILVQQNAKAVTAICWRARFSMRSALVVQQKLARIAAPALLYPKGGFDYPLNEAEMLLMLELYGVSG